MSQTFRCSLCGAGPLKREDIVDHLLKVHPGAGEKAGARTSGPTKSPTKTLPVEYWVASGPGLPKG
ncbi:hypothetical protein [Aquariibacter albus]|uniref:C2H2-type domain-containing protein n=1 Tax=Aquariibacter albus TaxID=2759899 RepID=A0A839HH99_9BURK|nr:hypothetical protein [Aquariibacter albus]MBB1161787.1 hypothetical protein [Aquariibacter albus]